MTYPTVTPTPGLDLVVVDTGVRMPAYDTTTPVAPPVETVVEAPRRAVPAAPPPPPVPVYPPKQDRN